MRKKSLCQIYLGWFLLLGMLFHIVIGHSDGLAEAFLSEQGESDRSFASAHHHGHHHSDDSDPDDPAQPSHDKQLTEEHPSAYTRPFTTLAHDLLSLRLAALLASLPRLIELPEHSLQLAARVDLTEPQPPPEQRQRALTTTILLI